MMFLSLPPLHFDAMHVAHLATIRSIDGEHDNLVS